MPLPIEDVLPSLEQALSKHSRAVLEAPPGAGKSTRLPLALLNAEWLQGQKILMLEPRRLAAINIARYLAQQLGEPPGQTVGYRIRGETRVSKDTRLEVVTEGILTRLLQQDPELTGYALVIFDEFHERSLHADTALAFALESQEALRDDLRLLVMSATLEGLALDQLLSQAPLITCQGRSFPIDQRYNPPRPRESPEQAVLRQVLAALEAHGGSLLVFLPGVGEIRRLCSALEERTLPADVQVTPLYGGLSSAEQLAAIKAPPGGQRKVVLATSIAETSLTIEGISVVIDAGLSRQPVFDPGSGMTRLETVSASQASCTQRSGRAGRLGPGVAYRLWDKAQHERRDAQRPAEIRQADLAPLALELAAWGTRADALRWLDPPPAAHLAQAAQLLQALDALDKRGTITAHGRAMARLPVHPRLAHMLLCARNLETDSPGTLTLACQLAALLEERDLLVGESRQQADISLRLRLVQQGRGGSVQRVRQQASRLARLLKATDPGPDMAQVASLLALAWPDRLAVLRPGDGSRYLLRNGKGAELSPEDPLCGSPFLAIAELTGRLRGQARIQLASPLVLADVEALFAHQIRETDWLGFETDRSGKDRLRGEKRRMLGALVLTRQPLGKIDDGLRSEALLGWIRERGLESLNWSPEADSLLQRLRCARDWLGEPWPAVDDSTLVNSLENWLAPFLVGLRQPADLKRVDLVAALKSLLPWAQQRELDALLPLRLAVPSGSQLKIHYRPGEPPRLSARLQELFGALETPRIAEGQVAVVIELLSPARRPVQVTSDLHSFWQRGYPEVKKELKGRYPKHYWPDDPFTAEATRYVRPRKG